MIKSISINLLTCLALMAFGFIIGRMYANKISKKQETTNIVTTESKKQEVSTLQEVKKDSTVVKEMTHEIVYYSPKGKVQKREFIETNYGAKTQLGIATASKIVDNELSSSTSKTSIITSYQSNWLVMMNYQVKLDSWNFQYRNIEFGLGYRLIGNLYTTAQTNTQFNEIKIGVIYGF